MPASRKSYKGKVETRSNDERLRDRGYRIHARPRQGPVLWKDPEGHVVEQGDALDCLSRVNYSPGNC